MSKTPLFRTLRRSLRLATLAQEHGIPLDEVAGWEAEEAARISRREFLKKGAMGVAGIAALSLLPSMMRPEDTETRIVIVGAGMAGLHAAHLLKKKGIYKNVRIFEASNRTGGRMFTFKLNGNTGTTELGGEFVDHDHADIRALAKEFGVTELLKSTDTLKPDLFWMDGKSYEGVDMVQAFQAVRKRIGKDAKAKGDALLALDRMSLAQYLEQLPADPWFKTLVNVAYTGEYGLELEEQSALNLVALIGKQKKGKFDMFGTSDEGIKLLGGNQQLCDRLADGVRDQIVLGAELVAIADQGKGYSLTFKDMKKAVEADIVIMTVPFTVLRGIDGIDKLAGMTPEKLRCIRELGAGQNGKYFLEMKERVWRDLGYQGYLYTPIIQTSWDSYHLQNENAGTSIYSVFFGGKRGTEVENGGGIAYLDEVNKGFPGFKDRFSGYTSQMNWWTHPWAKGSYICPKPGQYSTIVDHIASPVGNMLFAGEHVSVDFGGFMNGAAETGRLAAEKIIQMVKG